MGIWIIIQTKTSKIIEDVWGEPNGEDQIVSLKRDAAETDNGPEARVQWKNEVMLWMIEAQFSINSLKDSTENEDIKTLLHLFPPKEYQQEGSEKIKARIFQQATTWNNNGVMGGQKIIDAISFLRKEKETNTLFTNKLDDLIKMFISEVNKKLPKKCEDCNAIYTDRYTNKPTIKCFLCNIGRHDCQKDQVDNNKSWMDMYMWRMQDFIEERQLHR